MTAALRRCERVQVARYNCCHITTNARRLGATYGSTSEIVVALSISTEWVLFVRECGKKYIYFKMENLQALRTLFGVHGGNGIDF